MYTDEEITGYGFTPFSMGSKVEGLILQADHSEYKELTSASFPGVNAVIDGRRTMNPSNFPGVDFRVIGASINL